MGPTRQYHKHASVLLHNSLFYASSFSLWLPRHMHYQKGEKCYQEVMSILGKVLPIREEKDEVLNSSDASKKRKICAQEIEEGEGKTIPLDNDVLHETWN